ncbi:hypothetical protein E8E13_004845 [Curvularia kusanoi]|uniref:Uncharacterized protein n=1 Tax=Curvularia kusanoi TaxID=90978 RepID=A0A9P4WDF3_CURKU|nr:hypothetical protein E8E13_004845 [Curvularia kusanoi]
MPSITDEDGLDWVASLGPDWESELETRFNDRYRREAEKQEAAVMVNRLKEDKGPGDADGPGPRPADFLEVRSAFFDVKTAIDPLTLAKAVEHIKEVFRLCEAPTTKALISMRNWVKMGQEWATSPTWFLFLKSIGRYPLEVSPHPWEAYEEGSCPSKRPELQGQGMFATTTPEQAEEIKNFDGILFG